MAKLTNAVIDAAIRGFEAQKRDIDTQIAELRALKTGAPSASNDNEAPAKSARSRKGRKLSAAVRARMKAAQQARWAKIRDGSAPATKTVKPAKKKGGITPEGRRKLALAMKKRWAAKKAAA